MALMSYRVSGLTLRSARPLPYLTALPDRAGVPDVLIDFAPLPPLSQVRTVGLFRLHAGDVVDLVVSDALAIRISQGGRMTVDAGEGVPSGDLQTFLFGPAFAVLLHQRGQPPLHAGAVRIGDGVIAVAGHSGAGKSTLVRALMRRHHLLFSDDQMVVEAATGLAHAGMPAMKLWGKSAALFGQATEGAPRVRADLDKYHFDAAASFAGQSAPLRLICVLCADPLLTHPNAVRLAAAEAVATLGQFSHYGFVADAMGGRPAIFRWAAMLAGRTPVYLVRRPDDLARLDDLADLVLDLAARHGAMASEMQDL